MTHGLQQQDPTTGFMIPRREPSAQHGQKAGVKLKPRPEPRSFQPRPNADQLS
ncbi:hypothetical protein [Phenylobacterium aquaticum]|uniref:hypothetical protein n=1 Tax=Phenylobacterium aquaticum TaxID=1763816 RepID=UPI0026EEFC23|nr:hypothetical protein [Phenylobacterium aquaticum]